VPVDIRPAPGLDSLLETTNGLARDDKTNDKGVPHPLQTVILPRKYEMYLTKPPISVQKALFCERPVPGYASASRAVAETKIRNTGLPVLGGRQRHGEGVRAPLSFL
jgi:hypothetical protein